MLVESFLWHILHVAVPALAIVPCIVGTALAPADPVEALRDRPDAGQGGFSVADLCRRWRVGVDKVHGFIRRGELVAVNVATNLSGRPQWRVARESVELFEMRRSSAPLPKPQRRQRRPAEVDYFPD
jgi:hypothetical protein